MWVPSSRASIGIRLFIADVALAALSPMFALYVRDAPILTSDDILTVASYWAVSLISSLVAFVAFGIGNGIPRFFSLSDVMTIVKAVVASELMTSAIWFIYARLEGIPRSVSPLHALTLVVGLIAVRVVMQHFGDANRAVVNQVRRVEPSNLILIGLNELSVLYMKFLETCAGLRVIAVLDDDRTCIGRTVRGVRILGPPAQLDALIDEFAVHGMRIDGIVVSTKIDLLSDAVLNTLHRVCARHAIELAFLPRLPGVELADTGVDRAEPVPSGNMVPNWILPRYLGFKRAIDFCGALVVLIFSLPIIAIVTAMVFFDVGWPVIFWQQRTGLQGRNFFLHKFRTLRPVLDGRGAPIPETLRMSIFGSMLRRTRLDELPQLMNVLVGEMSLIGPRPLLPEDQPPPTTIRLMVRPGISGWAQVNGGTLLSPAEKGDLDEWYIRNASLWLDLRISCTTVLCLLRGNRRSEEALERARASGIADSALPGRAPDPPPIEGGKRSAVRLF
jgi:lipopolysaccharide/colanic/teichoic acid biosynthesis glycosyltransferase